MKRILGLLAFYLLFCIRGEDGTQSLMRFMWFTPVETLNLFNFLSNSKGILEKLKKETLEYYQNYGKSGYVLDKDATRTDGFYFHQQKAFAAYKICLMESERKGTDWKSCPHYLPTAMRSLLTPIKQIIQGYLQESMIQDQKLYELFNSPLQLEKSLFLWTSIHGNGSFHAAHHHKNSAISGVIYVSVPLQAGDFVFHDPRGAFPPFGKTLHIAPEKGMVVLFPSWLVHEVQPTTSSEPRISISFNLDGQWESTSDLSTAYVT